LTLTHDPVTGRFIIKPYILNACQNKEHTINPELNWKKCDVQNYQKLVTEQITDMDLPGIIDCEEQISKIIEILNNSVDNCAKKSKSRPKRSKPWTPEINSLCKLSKRIHWKWTESGTPKSKDSPLWMDCITAKRNLRRAQRQEEARKRNQLYSDIMESHMSNDKLFYKF
jgi:hypothetical protein